MLKDEQILYDALQRYALVRRQFAEAITSPDARKPDGKKFSQEDIADEIAMADQCDRLTARAKEKMDSPIVLLQ